VNRFKKSELALLVVVLTLIGVSEYYFLYVDPLKAIFIGLWCPTILGFVVLVNLKTLRNGKY
jgi:hypothetical protein